MANMPDNESVSNVMSINDRRLDAVRAARARLAAVPRITPTVDEILYGGDEAA